MSFDWWYEALDGRIGQMTTTPEEGYYKTRRKNGPWEPVAIWLDSNDDWLAIRGNQKADAHQIWEWCRTHPVTHEAYLKALAEGVWDDDDPTVAAAFSGIGHNVGEVDELDLLRDQIESAKQGAEAYAKITSDEQANKAQSLRARLNELAGTADKTREKLKRPYLEAGKEIDAQWMPLVKEAKGIADVIRRAIADHETAKLQARRAEERRLEQERQREGAKQIGEPAPPPPPPTVAVKGTYGRAATVGTELVVTKITDAQALFAFFTGNAELDQFMVQLAQRAVKAGFSVPGVEVEERARIS